MKRLFLSLKAFYKLCFWGLLGVFGKPLYVSELVVQMNHAGPGTLVIALITTFVVGMALSIQVLNQFEGLGLESEVGRVIGVSVIREICPITLALVFAGRVGSGISAELAGMVQREQIDTFRAFGVNPIKKLVTPRIFGALIMLPSLTFIGDYTAIIGGAFITTLQYHTDSQLYWSSIRSILDLKNTIFGVVKPFVFGFLIATISCHVGLRSQGGSLGLKSAATKSYVLSTVTVMISDFLITKVIWIFFP
ncbi:MAG TPA: ABC transporter permease [Chitinispirillaceae bacterium]|nr:ABC transporter permease [Chitinispirillaceae bacterium]